MPEQLPKDVNAAANLLLVIAVLLASSEPASSFWCTARGPALAWGGPPKPWRRPLLWLRLSKFGRR